MVIQNMPTCNNKARGLFIRSASLFTTELKEAFYVKRVLD